MKLTPEQRAQARAKLAQALRERQTKPKPPPFDWDDAIARLRDMLDEIDRKR